jgi:hypothetical protein
MLEMFDYNAFWSGIGWHDGCVQLLGELNIAYAIIVHFGQGLLNMVA